MNAIIRFLENKNVSGAFILALLFAIVALWLRMNKISDQLETSNVAWASKLEYNNKYHERRKDVSDSIKDANHAATVNRLIMSYESQLSNRDVADESAAELKRKLSLIERNVKSVKKKVGQ